MIIAKHTAMKTSSGQHGASFALAKDWQQRVFFAPRERVSNSKRVLKIYTH
jgi:hypothetical protein